MIRISFPKVSTCLGSSLTFRFEFQHVWTWLGCVEEAMNTVSLLRCPRASALCTNAFANLAALLRPAASGQTPQLLPSLFLWLLENRSEALLNSLLTFPTKIPSNFFHLQQAPLVSKSRCVTTIRPVTHYATFSFI